MMKLTLLVLVSTTIPTGYLQEMNNGLLPTNVASNNTKYQIWDYQGLQGQRRRKPCPKRRYKNGEDEPWIPSFSSRITQPLYETPVLQPLALKNDNVNESKTDIESEDQLNVPEGRLFDISKRVQLNADDCVEYFGSNNESATTEDAAVKMIKDCLKSKQKSDIAPESGSSRRSMSEPDHFDNMDRDGNNNYPLETDPVESEQFDGDSNINGIFPRDSDDNSRHANTHDSEDKYDNQLTSKLLDPARGIGMIIGQPSSIFLQDPRVCYACSTATNPSCWEPDIRTTVKYCPKEQSCVTKSLGVKNSLTIIRDCATSCEDSWLLGIEPRFTSCELCHADYCNGAVSIDRFHVIIVLVIGIAKCVF